MEEGVVEMREGELLPENVCWGFEEDGRKGAVLRVCEYEHNEARESRIVEWKRCMEAETLLCKEIVVLQ